MAVHVLLNKKGGVGKTTMAVNLAAVTAHVMTDDTADADSPVGLVSIDPQGSMEWWVGQIEAANNQAPFNVIQAYNDPMYLRALDKVDGIEHMYVDTPGWLGDEAQEDGGGFGETIQAVIDVADLIIVPMMAQAMDFAPTFQTIENVIKPSGVPYVVVINRWAPATDQVDLEQAREFIDRNGWPRAKTAVRSYKVHARAAANGVVATMYPPNRNTFEARGDFMNLALELGSRDFAKEAQKLEAEMLEAQAAAAEAAAQEAEVN